MLQNEGRGTGGVVLPNLAIDHIDVVCCSLDGRTDGNGNQQGCGGSIDETEELAEHTVVRVLCGGSEVTGVVNMVCTLHTISSLIRCWMVSVQSCKQYHRYKYRQ